MPKSSVITSEVAEAMLESFRTAPGVALRAANQSGCHRRTAKKAWDRGLISCQDPKYHRPFEQILLEEQREVRARVEREEREASALAATAEASRRGNVHEKAIDDLTKQRSQEEQLVRNARAATIVLLNNVTNIAAGATALGQKVRSSLEAYGADQAKLTITQSKDVVGLIGRLSTSLRQLNDAGQKAMEMSRLLVGEPTHIVGIQHLQSIPMHEAKERIEAAQRAIARLDDAGLNVIDADPHSLDPELN